MHEPDLKENGVRIDIQGSLGKYGVESFVQSLASSLKKINIQASITPPLGSLATRAITGRRPTAENDLQKHLVRSPGRQTHLLDLNQAFQRFPLFLTPS